MDSNPGTSENETVEMVHTGDVHLGTTVVHALAEATDTDPVDMEVELNAILDPDALDRLFDTRTDGTPRSGGSVTFELLDCAVTVDADADEIVVIVE
jgi:hypothetical protein